MTGIYYIPTGYLFKILMSFYAKIQQLLLAFTNSQKIGVGGGTWYKIHKVFMQIFTSSFTNRKPSFKMLKKMVGALRAGCINNSYEYIIRGIKLTGKSCKKRQSFIQNSLIIPAKIFKV